MRYFIQRSIHSEEHGWPWRRWRIWKVKPDRTISFYYDKDNKWYDGIEVELFRETDVEDFKLEKINEKEVFLRVL